MEHKSLLMDCAKEMGVELTEEMLSQFETYFSLLIEWNEKMNLTAITEEREVVLKHFADCISVLPHLALTGKEKIIDVGTGAGFPGIPLKIACPSLEVTLLDSLQKRIGFLEEVGRQLNLEGVTYLHSRAEDGGQNPELREQFDLCVSRAVANLSVLSEYCLPFVKTGGRLAALKGPDALRELEEAQGALKKLGGTLEKVVDVEIPFTDLRHKLVIIRKTEKTPAQYPRKAGKIQKNPLR
ncbi:16S rRNA (guanine(527)-N(7))-methyltransferase RsmG [Anaerotignum lactatifermentans]|uniref:Ribosomal RNA small subunit methyltransferase G n=1 Tax=Anaerotignum lactatifermentans TaxID=160404 RepID=A0ABS2G9Z7_9FIRM|nr:16S rRNA (guanine(527)-N(7))-methyltransferase RsmG [Anaerotignum lactatifermentans]MBM6830073.1 16S rRNA (guanine(527)-N(7))-methyltransferase RsmG [Anaerotignum lactatifermentans]MBM6878316.1 16S rRNA (guanine(527)-N(7))-methyltransferase RsmG [Anaerotignum lactatifermentans]MBM6951471.1 16S rRNA (guanine(527)-N(7))-methyltransferase RsmG [Anaerotignum lactatifermentans]